MLNIKTEIPIVDLENDFENIFIYLFLSLRDGNCQPHNSGDQDVFITKEIFNSV